MLKKEDQYLKRTLKGAAIYFCHTPDDQARIAKVSHATWYRRLQNPSTFTLAELRRLIAFYKIDISEICDFLGIRREQR